MPNRNKQRGNELEYEVRDVARAYGIPAERARGSDGRSLGFAEDVDCVVGGFKIQCKRKKVLPKWIDPGQYSEDVDIIVTRKDGNLSKLAIMPFETLLELITNDQRRTKKTE